MPAPEKVEFKKTKKALPAGLAKRLAAKRKAAGLPTVSFTNFSNDIITANIKLEKVGVEIAKPENKVDQEQAKKAAAAAMEGLSDFKIPGLDLEKIKALMEGKPLSKPPGLKPGEQPTNTKSGVNYVNMPSEVPISIPGLPAGWKFGDEMPTGFIPEPEPEKPNVALEIAQSKRRRKRPDQPVVFQVNIRFWP